MNPDKEAKDLTKKLNSSRSSKNNSDLFHFYKKWDAEEIAADKELQKMEAYLRRRERIEEIQDKANNERIARCERKMAEVGKDKFMDLIHSGKWSDFEGRTEIEIEYDRLRREEFHEDWFREHGKPYRMEDDPNAKF